MVYSTLANMDFQGILFEAQANTQTGENLLNKYKSFLLANEVTCRLVNSFVQEAKSCLYNGIKLLKQTAKQIRLNLKSLLVCGLGKAFMEMDILLKIVALICLPLTLVL